MAFPYKNPISPIQVLGPQSVDRSVVFGTHFSTNGTGGYMEVFSLSGLTYEIPVGQTGSIEYSGNTIPINFVKGTGAVYSPDVLILNSDNISSGRRKLGMLAYVYEQDQVYQYDIPNYEQLWTAATASTNCVVINEFGTTVRNNTTEGQAFINAWTASTIEGVNGVVRANARWKKYWGNNLSVTGGSYNGVTNTLTLVNITGGTVNIPGFGGGGGGGASFTGGTFTQSNLEINLTSTAGTLTISGVTGLYISGGSYSSGNTTLTLSNSTGGTLTITGFSRTFSGGSGNCINQLYLNEIYPCTSDIKIQPLSAGKVYFGKSNGSSGFTVDLVTDTSYEATRLGLNTNSPQFTFDFYARDRKNRLYFRDNLTSAGFVDIKNIIFSGDPDTNASYTVASSDASGQQGAHGISIGIRGYTTASSTLNDGAGKAGDAYVSVFADTNGLNIINGPGNAGVNTEDYIRFYAGQLVNNNTPDIHIQGSGNTRGFVGVNVTGVTNQLHVSATTHPIRLEGLQSSANTRYLVANSDGVVTYTTVSPGGGGGDSITGGTFNQNNLNLSLVSSSSTVTISGVTGLYISGGSYNTGTTTLSLFNSTGGTLTITGFSQTFSGGSGNCINQLYLNEIYPCTSDIKIQPLSAGKVYFGSSSAASGFTVDLVTDTSYKSTRLGLNTNSPEYTFDFFGRDRKNRFYFRDNLTGIFSDIKNIIFSGESDLNASFGVISSDASGQQGAHGISIGILGYNVASSTLNDGAGKPGDTYITAFADTNGLNIINGPGSGGANTEDYIRFYAGQIVNDNIPDIHIQGSGNTRGYVGINITGVTNQLHVSADTNPVRFEGIQQSGLSRYLVVDNSGVVYYTTGTTTGGTSTSGDYLPLSGGTVSGNTIFQSGVTAATISATTYLGLPYSGTTNYVVKWTNSTGLTNSLIYDNGSIVVVSGTSATVAGSKFSVTGPIAAQGVQLSSKNGSIALATSNYSSWGTGGSQIAIGDGSPLGASTGTHNIAIGSASIKNAVTPSGNTAIGTETLNVLNDGNYNVVIGYAAGQSLDQTSEAVYIGYKAGYNGSLAGSNVVIGSQAAYSLSGTNNVAIGTFAFGSKTTGNGSVAIGTGAGRESTGGGNVFIGYQAGYNSTGDNKLYIHNSLGNPPLIYGEFDNLRLGIGTTAVTNTLHVSATTHPLRLQGLVSSANTRFLVANSDGVITYTTGGGLNYYITGSTPSGITINSGDRWFNTESGLELVYINDGDSSQWIQPNTLAASFTGNSPASCISELYVTNIYGCSPINFNNQLNIKLGAAISGNTTFTGPVNLSSGFTANTISATTYQNLPTDIRTTGGTYSNNTFTFTNNTGGTYSVLFNTITGLTVNGNLTVTGTTSSPTFTGNSLTLSNSASTIYLDNTTAQQIKFYDAGRGVPTYNSYSSGAKIIFSDNISSISSGFAIGVDTGTLWYGADLAGNGHDWYAGTKKLATLVPSLGFKLIGLGSTSDAAFTISGNTPGFSKGGDGYTDFLRVINNATGTTNTNKWFRMNSTGGFEILNSSYTSIIFSLADNGITQVAGGNLATTSSNDAQTNYLTFGSNNTQIYDDGNTHIHSRSSNQSMWINTNGGQINIGTQTTVSGGALAPAITMGSSTVVKAYLNVYGGKTYTIGSYGYLFTGGAGTGGGTTATYGIYTDNRIEAVEFDATSDERLKNIEGDIQLNDAINLVNNITPIKFTWKNKESEGIKAGYSAQQVVKSGFGHLVSQIKNEELNEVTDNDGFISPKGMQLTMNYDQVTPYHGVVIKHLLEEIENLKKEIKELKNKIN